QHCTKRRRLILQWCGLRRSLGKRYGHSEADCQQHQVASNHQVHSRQADEGFKYMVVRWTYSLGSGRAKYSEPRDHGCAFASGKAALSLGRITVAIILLGGEPFEL